MLRESGPGPLLAYRRQASVLAAGDAAACVDAVNAHMPCSGFRDMRVVCEECTAVKELITCADLQVRLEALWRHCIWQDDVFQSIAQLALHQAAVLLQLCVQQVLHICCSRLFHLQASPFLIFYCCERVENICSERA